MSISIFNIYLLLVSGLLFPGEKTPVPESPAGPEAEYWFRGKAEISSYDLEQARYGEIHQGEAVLVFVTEDFSRSKHVKLDYPEKDPADAVKVMKLNFMKNFLTGIYPYSMMSSTFTPYYYEKESGTLKVSSSVQEWCGNAFTQLNLRNGRYEGVLYSYFESEGDQNFSISKTWLEDEIWNLIRVAPDKLPVGDFTMIPGVFYQRLSHKTLKREEVTAGFIKGNSEDTRIYSLQYNKTGRTLHIEYRKEYPHEIEGWEEQHTSGYGAGKEGLVTRANKKATIFTDYWNQNSVADISVRKQLKLEIPD